MKQLFKDERTHQGEHFMESDYSYVTVLAMGVNDPKDTPHLIIVMKRHDSGPEYFVRHNGHAPMVVREAIRMYDDYLMELDDES